jgi:glycosyltransferase involved in cell wall biosynthesis
MSKYAEGLRHKARVLPHAFDPALFETKAPDAASKITVRYLGDLYGRRTPKPLVEALRLMTDAQADSLSDVRFELIGPTYDLPLGELKLETLPEGLVTLREPVGYLESLALMAASDGLLVIDAPAEQSVFLPSKLIDYVGAGRPVLGLTPGGTASRLIRELGGWVADPSDARAVAKTLGEFLDTLRRRRGEQNSSPRWGTPEVRRRYEAATVARAFEDILGELNAD